MESSGLAAEDAVSTALIDLEPIKIDGHRFQIRFWSLYLELTHVAWIGNVLELNPHITCLHFTGLQLSNEAMIELAKILNPRRTITSIKFVNTEFDAAYSHLFMNITFSVKKLKVENCLFGPIQLASQFFATLLHCQPSIEKFSCRRNQLDSKCVASICDELKRNSKLKELDLSFNKFGDAGATQLAALLASNKYIKVLNITNCGIGEEGAISIANGLKVTNTLEVLDLSAANLGLSTKTFGEASRVNSSLQSLHLRSSTKQYLHYLLNGLCSNTGLRTLSIPGSVLNDEDCLALNEFLKKNSTLTTLDMNTSVTHAQIQTFEGLKSNKGLKTLEWTKIPSFQLNLLSHALKYNSTLTSLNVQNGLTEIDEKRICEAMNHNHTVEALYMFRSGATLNSLSYVCDMIRRNRSLAHLKFGFNFQTKEEINQFINAVQENTFIYVNIGLPSEYNQENQILEELYDRNKRIRNEIFKNVVVLMYNIVRSNEASEILPIEVWMTIFKHWKYPGINEQLDQRLYELCNDHSIRRVAK